MSLFDLSGKSAIITGSSRGIGRAIAEAMADAGAKVTISSRKPGPCQEVAAGINEKHGDGTAIAVPANISSKDENNIISNHWLIQMCMPQMRDRKDGAIILVSSIGGLRGSPIIGAYNISKAADFQLARNLATEYGKDNIRVNCIAPGLIRTDFARALWEDPKNLKSALSGTPMARIGEPEEIAGAAVYLASKAGAYMTGQMMVVDGGATC